MNWKEAVVHPRSTLTETLDKINRGSIGLALVSNPDGVLIGIVTDGDIRRALLSGKSLSSPVQEIMNQSPLTCPASMTHQEIRRFMRSHKIEQLPILDDQKRTVNVVSINSELWSSFLPNAALLMCGGLGTRLRPLTETCPKPLLRVGSKPILEIIIESLIDAGFRHFYFSVRYRSEMIRDYFGNGEQYGIDIEYVEEDDPLGTAGALGLLPDTPSDDLLVMNGDLLTKVNFQDLISHHHDSGALATMAVREYTYKVPFGVVNCKDNVITSLSEKPSYAYLVNAGIYAISPQLIDMLRARPHQPLDMPDLFNELINNGKKTLAYPLKDYWLDIGRIDDFNQAQQSAVEIFGA